MRHRVCLVFLILLASFTAYAQQASPTPEVVYTVSLARGSEHMLDITVDFQEEGTTHTVFLPVWNALYQIRDFAQFVSDVRASDALGHPLTLVKREKSTWELQGTGRVRISYSIYANDVGPFGAEVNGHHAFLNLAELLMFTSATRHELATVRFIDLPAQWILGVALPSLNVRPSGSTLGAFLMHAADYDHLVDSPVELGEFTELRFAGNAGESYRVLVDSDAPFDRKKVIDHLKKIIAAETAWMQDVPFKEYTFLYHFRAGGWGGMEHSYSTVIDVSRPESSETFEEFDSVSAHEFFHLWNVKRIRPRSLEPVDYMKENYTDALWFSEGCTTTVGRISLLAAGLMTQEEYFEHLATEISVLQSRPARNVQPVTEASIDTWFDKYRYYRSPERSINYYNKGDVLGVLLDLAIREATHGKKSLRDVFLYMNTQYGKPGKTFADTDAVRHAVEKVTGSSFDDFFRRYITGTDELPYDALYRTAGMKLEAHVHTERELGFDWASSGSMWVIKGPVSSQASAVGLNEGDVLVAIDHQPPSDSATVLDALGDRKSVTVTVSHGSNDEELVISLVIHDITSYRLLEDSHATPEQLQRRKEWLGKSK